MALTGIIKIGAALAVASGAGRSASAKGFENLNFERARPDNVMSGGIGLVSELLPSWKLTLDGRDLAVIAYDIVVPGTPAAVLASRLGRPLDVLQGTYTPVFQVGLPEPYSVYRLSQSGTVPEDTLSLRFQSGESGAIAVSVDGIRLKVIDESPNSLWHAIDVSLFAGQDVVLEFETVGGVYASLDNVQFSPNPVIPEPGTARLVLLGLGVMLLSRAPRRRVAEGE